MGFVIAAPETVELAIVGSSQTFPVRRVYCAGMNYKCHIKEMGLDPDEPRPAVFFGKPVDNVVPSGTDVPYPPLTEDFQFEAELVVAIGARGFRLSVEEADDVIWGYATGNDLTRRDLQIALARRSRPWELGKWFDRSAPCGALVPKAEVKDIANAEIWLKVNGEFKQRSNINQMIRSVPELIAAASEYFVLEPGDLIYTGTPAGVGKIGPGDVVEVGVRDLPTVVTRITDPI